MDKFDWIIQQFWVRTEIRDELDRYLYRRRLISNRIPMSLAQLYWH